MRTRHQRRFKDAQHDVARRNNSGSQARRFSLEVGALFDLALDLPV
jgi:hypothetical protein